MANSKNLKMKAYTILKQQILSNELKPGEYLEEKKLCEMLSISRTPIREAISKLEWENLVQIIPNKGIFVTTLSIRTAKEIFQVRHLLETIILRLSIPNLDPDMLMHYKHSFLELLEKKDYVALHLMDYQFHNDINACCGNTQFVRIMANISDQFQRVRTQEFYRVERTENGAREHIELIDLMLHNKTEEAVQLLEKHISSTEKFFFQSL